MTDFELYEYSENKLKEKGKRIAELIDLIHAERKRQEQCDDIHLRKIAELEKENAELKKEVELWKKASENNSYKAFQLQEENKSLTNIKNIYIGDLLKAKELLKDITSSYGSTEVSEAQLYCKIKKAEMFLKEVEK
jgi:hypothetical protein